MPEVEYGPEFNASLPKLSWRRLDNDLRLMEDHNLTQRLLLR